uniref:Protein MEMO1 n=1 Tax=Phaeomonas parva TaxID=124430 RepID=A0A7S1XWN0_9STRA|mmetsp:Transcript_401/g.1033  ORF Transcript_401/g.1033 Transcript_401/m.1033 type:complete len:320 (+) Transcript_401:257-1216(+)
MMFSRRRQQSCLCCYTRQAEHAGSWYSDDGARLGRSLEGFLEVASAELANSPYRNGGQVRALIAPHAGYDYSGPTAAYAYDFLRPELWSGGDGAPKRIFILGPSHHVYLSGCALSGAERCATPVGDLVVDQEIIRELHATGEFVVLEQDVDEAEHSLEMHMPYIASRMAGAPGATIVPIMVGATSYETEQKFGALLAPYLADPANFFVVSSDFCHWGSRFRYQPYDRDAGVPRHAYIEALDRRGMELIEAQDAAAFHDYLQDTKNTICGRHPIGVLLQMLSVSDKSHSVDFVKYAQSSPVQHPQDSSVSYASAIVRLQN